MSGGGRTSERERIAWLGELFGGATIHPAGELSLGIGDDAAVFGSPLAGESLVWSIDAQVEGTHFERRWMSLGDVGYRATMAALSDLAAMGARPMGVLSGLALPSELSDRELRELAVGQRQAVDALGTVVAGGNLARSSELSITTTVLGATRRPLLRSSASPDATVWLAGRLGLSAAGLRLRMAGSAPRTALEKLADEAFRRPTALIEQGLLANGRGATALVDVSDGLAIDAAELATKSRVAVVLDLDTLADAEVITLAAVVGEREGAPVDPLELVLHGGEDFALIAVAPTGVVLDGFRRIGVTTSELDAGLWGRRGSSVPSRIPPRGFDHFA